MRNPIITKRDTKMFLCRSRQKSLTSYSGLTPEEAYEQWAKYSRSGSWHKYKVGFRNDFIRSP